MDIVELQQKIDYLENDILEIQEYIDICVVQKDKYDMMQNKNKMLKKLHHLQSLLDSYE